MATLAEMLRQGADKLINLPSEAQRFITNPQAFTQLLTGKNPLPRETGFAAGVTGLPAQEMSVLDTNQAPYMQGYTQGEPVGYAGMALPFAAPAATATAKTLAPKLGQVTENYMVRQGMIQPITAYHGSSKSFENFDKSKIREGIGTDYGYGGYFAELPETAKDYMGKKGFFYKTDIPDEFIPKMINWSSSDQSEEVNKLLKKVGLPTNIRGEDIYFAAIEKTGGSDAKKSGFQKASEYLDSIGIKGITYPQRSYETDAVSKNFVVFEPSQVKILEKNDKPVSRKELIQEQIDKIE